MRERIRNHPVRSFVIAGAIGAVGTFVGVSGYNMLNKNPDSGSVRNNTETLAGTPTPRPSGATLEPTSTLFPTITPTPVTTEKTADQINSDREAQRRRTRELEEEACKTAAKLEAERMGYDNLVRIAKLSGQPTPVAPDPCKDNEAKPTPTATPPAYPMPASSEATQQPGAYRLIRSEVNIPNDGSRSITRPLGPNEIVAFSGGEMTIDYVDEYGYQRPLSRPGGPGRVTLAFFLGDRVQTNFVSVRGVVERYNWAGAYDNIPNQDPQNWQRLMEMKKIETMTESTSVIGGAKVVDVVVLDGRTKRLVYQNTFIKQ